MYSFNDKEMFYDVADGLGIVVNITTGIYYSLNNAGTAVFEQLKAGADPKAISGELSKLQLCPADIEQRVLTFADSLVQKGILIEDSTPGNEPSPFDSQSFSDGFDLAVDEFHEVQDLIMADPIHDVDPNYGWPAMKDDEKK